MQIGDVVVPSSEAPGKYLHCGSGMYTHAIVGSIEPFILVSSQGGMLWSKTWSPHEVTPLCQASREIQEVVQQRVEEYLQKERLKDGRDKEATSHTDWLKPFEGTSAEIEPKDE